MAETRDSISDILKSILKIESPMLMLDAILNIEPQRSCHAVKNVTYNEWFFPAHYPEEPIMPGTLQIEALTQAAALTVLFQPDKAPQSSARCPILLASVDKCRFYRPVSPGDRLDIYITVDRFLMGVSQATAQGKVDDQIVCEAKITHKIIG